MGNNKFLKRLQKELPVWIEQGWVNSGADKSILEHVSQQHSSHMLAFSLAILGVLLTGSGVISFFAANWEEMSKIAKLLVLLGSMWLSYAAAAYLTSKGEMPRTGQALVLLGVILFGANIMLIAQIYHIHSHFPNGVLMWAAGGLVSAYLLRSQAALVAALALAMLWTGMESLGFTTDIHWWFLLFLLSTLPLIYRRHWMFAAHVFMAGLLMWSLFTYGPADVLWPHSHILYLTQFYFVCYLGLFIAGMLLATSQRLARFSVVVQRYSALAALASFYMLTFPDMQSGMRWVSRGSGREAADTGWLVVTLLGLTVVAGLAYWHRQRTLDEARPAYLQWGLGLVVAVILLIVLNMFLQGHSGSIMAILFNVMFFAGMIWLIYAGIDANDRLMVNMAFAFFALTLLSRYFDTFWTLLNRSFFFMAGGLLLIAGGYILEKKRRLLTAKIRQQQAGQEVQS